MTQTNNEMNAVEAAKTKVTEIEQAVIDGNKKINATDLANARAALEFAELQEAAREIARQTNAEAEKKAHLLDLQKRLKVIADSRRVVDSKFAEFEKSLANYLTAATTYQNNLNSIRGELQSAGMYPEPGPIIAGVEPGLNVYGIRVTDFTRQLAIGEVAAKNVSPDDAVKPVIEASLAEYNRNF